MITGICVITPLSITSAQIDTEWKLFTSLSFKFSIEYPSELDVENNLFTTARVLFVPPTLDSQFGSVFVAVYPHDMDLQEFIDEKLDTNDFGETTLIGEPTPLTINNDFEGMTYMFTTFADTILTKEVVFVHDNLIYQFSMNGLIDDFNDAQFTHMINSIKLIK